MECFSVNSHSRFLSVHPKVQLALGFKVIATPDFKRKLYSEALKMQQGLRNFSLILCGLSRGNFSGSGPVMLPPSCLVTSDPLVLGMQFVTPSPAG